VPLNMVNKKLVVGGGGGDLPSESYLDRAIVPAAGETRSAQRRRRETIAYRPLFEKVARKLVKNETTAVRKAVKEMVGERSVGDFLVWLDDFYRERQTKIEREIDPTLSTYATALLPLAQEETGSTADVTLEYTDFVGKYRARFAKQHVISSQEQLRYVVSKAQDAGEDVEKAVVERLDEWEERRPGKIVARETIQAESAFTHAAFAALGVMKIRSVANPGACPYCAALDGKVIGIEEAFLSVGDFQPEGVDEPLTVMGTKRHPPYHDGCICGIAVSI